MTQPDEPDGTAIEQEIGAAIADVLARHENGFTTKWLALVETIDADGESGLWTLTSDDLKAWDTVGMLTHGLHLQMRQTMEAEQ